MSETRSGRMNTNSLELKVDTLKIKNKQPTDWLKASKPSDVSKPTRSKSMGLEVRRNTPDKFPEQRPNTPDNEATGFRNTEADSDQLKTESTKITMYPTPLFSLFPPVSQNGAIFGEEDSESNKEWKREYRNARYLMERQKARYLALRKGRDKAVLCKECETKGEKALRIGGQNSRKPNKSKHCDKTFVIEGHVVKESDGKHTFDSRGIPTNFYLPRNRMKASFEECYEKQNKPITTGRKALSKMSFERLQPWVTIDKNNKHGLKMKQDFPHSCFRMYLPHHC